jgi:hypothetical protein
MWSSAVLLAFGVVFEFAGIVLLGFPNFVPGAIRLSGWLRRRGRRAAKRLRRLVGLRHARLFIPLLQAEQSPWRA